MIVAVTQIPREKALAVMEANPEITALLREESGFDQEGNELDLLPGGRVVVGPEGNYGSLERVDLIRNEDGSWRPRVTSRQVDASVPDDRAALALQQRYAADMEQRLSTRIACSATPVTRPTTLGALTSKAFREALGADLEWVNAGGLRADLPAGDLSMRSALSVLPFDNKLMLLRVNGGQLKQALEQGADSNPAGNSGGYPLVSGFSFRYDTNAPAGSRISDLRLEDGTPITDDSVHTLAVTNYVYNGGNGVTALGGAEVVIDAGFGGSDVDALIAGLKQTSTCDAVVPVPEPSPTPSASSPAPAPATPTPTGAPAPTSAPTASVAPTPAGSPTAQTAAAPTGPNNAKGSGAPAAPAKSAAKQPAGMASTGISGVLPATLASMALLLMGVGLLRRRA